MGELIDGRFDEDTKEAIIDVMVADLEDAWGEDLPNESASVARDLYAPVAEWLAECQRNIGLVLDAAQIEFATGRALDLLCALIGVVREQAKTATGTVTFSRDTAATSDYVIKKGTLVQTDGSEPRRFETTEQVTLAEGTTSVDAAVKAEKGGTKWNVGAGTIILIPDPPAGLSGDGVNNAAETSGGKAAEQDDELRERAQEQLANGARATGPALLSAVKAVKGVTSVNILINDTADDNGRGYGLPSGSFEMVVTHDGTQQTMETVAQSLMDTKAVGDISATGVNGQSLDETLSWVINGEIITDLPNGQTHPVGFSESVKVDIFVDASFDYEEPEYPGDNAVKDAIVDYIGGYTSSGFEQDGELSTSDNVLIGEVEYAIRDVPGVYDVSELTIGTADAPTGTTNVDIGNYEQSITDARDGATELTFTTTEV